MEQFLVYAFVIMLLYFVSTKYARKEAVQYFEENTDPKNAEDLSKFDPTMEVVVDFRFKCPKGSFLIQSKPNLIINNEKYKIIADKLTLHIHKDSHYHFGVPYMKGESFKTDGHFNFDPGYHYEVIFKTKIFVFQSAKVLIKKIGSYPG